MEKNVSGVDLEELKRAREQLNEEMGIENDPNMYDNYNPNRLSEESDGSEKSGYEDIGGTEDFHANEFYEDESNDVQENSETNKNEIEQNKEDGAENEEDSPRNFDVYDNFSAFEVNSGAGTKSESENLDSQMLSSEDVDVNLETSNDSEEVKDDNDLSYIGTLNYDDDFVLENAKTEDVLNQSNNQEEDSKPTENQTLKNEETDEKPENLEQVSEDGASENITVEKATDNSSETEIIDDYTKLGHLDELLYEDSQDKSDEPVFEKPKILYSDIEPYEYVDVIAQDEFKNSDKLSYILGKSEDGKLHFGHLRDFYNIAIFGRESNSVVSLIHSVILSLVLKNSVSEVNFVICDSKADSKFEVYNKSTYMYFNRIAKTNKEILDTLIEMTKELEERYKILAMTGVKTIEQYNIISKNDNLKPLPYIVTVFNNYSKSIQLTESDKINTCLYQLLKLGRTVGMYEIVVANTTIKSEEINYNLPTRIAFLTDDEDTSLRTLGEVGAEQLPSSNDFLFSSLEKDGVIHLRVPNLTKKEVELLIDNINE